MDSVQGRQVFSACPSPDEGILEYGCPDSKDKMLGTRDGWLASPSGYPPAEMVPVGHRTGSNERV